MFCTYDEHKITVHDSYMLEYDVLDFCHELRDLVPNVYCRSSESWAKELIVHNFFCNLGLLETHTIDTDLDDNESFFRLFGYNVVYGLLVVFNKFDEWFFGDNDNKPREK